MKFILDHDIQRKTKPGLPLEIRVEPEWRTGEYPAGCTCQWVFRIHAESMHALKEMGMVLDENKSTCVCLCMGRLHAEAVGELLATTARPLPVMPKLTKALAIIDIEGTSLDVSESRIVEWACTVMNPDGSRKRWCMRFKPDIPIPAEATAIHGISDADVARCPPFREYAAKIQSGLAGKDIGGYNLRGYDLPVMENEMARAGLKFSIDGAAIVDVFGIYQKMDPRDLSAAVRKYAGGEHDGAHGAQADCDATADVLCGQLAAHQELSAMSIEELAKFSARGDHEIVDLAGKIGRNKDGKLVFLFGKHRNATIESEPGFGLWILGKDFPASTCEAVTAELKRIGCI